MSLCKKISLTEKHSTGETIYFYLHRGSLGLIMPLDIVPPFKTTFSSVQFKKTFIVNSLEQGYH